MRKTLHVLLLISLLVSFTSSKPLDKFKVAPLIEPISLEEAAQMISNFLHIKNYEEAAKNVALGGAFNTAAFKIPAGKAGVLFWFCQNGTNKNYPTFFLALEHAIKYDTVHGVPAPKNSMTAPDYTFTYPETAIDVATVAQFLQSQTIANQRTTKPIDVPTVVGFVKEFQALISKIGNCETDNCKYPHSYFDGTKGNYMSKFLSHNPVMVRYYLGYDKNYYKNNIRVILIGTDNSGKNIILSMRAGEEGTILQKSWPPPPSN
jgi:hypothetical protein